MNLRQALTAARVIGGTGYLLPVRPLEYLGMAVIARRWGMNLATASAVAALRAPRVPAVVDDAGPLTWRELDGAANAVAHALHARGVAAGQTVGLLCRNNRYFVEALLAVSKLGADLVLLNADFGPHQLEEVLAREGIGAAVFDDDCAPAMDACEFDGVRVDEAALRDAVSSERHGPPAPPGRTGRVVIMTSGTTGLPKGARRSTITPPTDVVVGAFSQLPLRAGEPVVVAPPMFHALGFGFLGFAVGLHGTLVVRSRFDPETVLADVAAHRATTLVAVPVMLQRIVSLSARVRRRYDTSSLRVVVCSGSRLDPELARSVMDDFGDVLYNFYGSTEVGWATVAGPADLRAAPGTAGRPPPGTRVAVLDDGRLVGPGRTGRIFVGSPMAFEGYTGGGGKEVVAGLMRTGDTGHLDEAGRLFVEGRDDEMIVSGGENVFPGEVEELLRSHELVADAAVVGVEDEEMGQRLAAFVVRRPGSSLSAEEVRDYVRGQLARYKIPRDVGFVDEIPRNAIGKVLRQELEARSAPAT